MAGHFYCFAYVRDMSGVLRGLLALGYYEEAKKILEFWIHIFDLYGNLCDAEGMDSSIRLPWFNDEVEVPSYAILSFFKYQEYIGDEDLLQRAFPLMKWAFEAQLPHLCEGMLEFNSDETYIAGGVFPMRYLYHGSAEATLLFINAGERLLEWTKKNAALPPDKQQGYEDIVRRVKDKYRDNFVSNGNLYANNPRREETAGAPRFRYSYCEAPDCASDGNVPVTWTERSEEGYYLCPRCRNKKLDGTRDQSKKYILNSVCMVPLYIGDVIFTAQETVEFLRPCIDTYRKTGLIPSNREGARSLGHDYGVALYNAVKTNDKLADRLLTATLDAMDGAGAWAEYYDQNKPAESCCRCRAWESAVNMEAVISFFTESAVKPPPLGVGI
jgi:hypothetical protein